MKRATAKEEKNNDRQNISIHALVKRATGKDLSIIAIADDFNPRPREEGDRIIVLNKSFKRTFQSTPS